MENQDIPETLDNYYILNDDTPKGVAYTLNELAILKINGIITSNTLVIKNSDAPKPVGTFLDSYDPNILNSLETEDSKMLPEELNTFNLGACMLAPLWGYCHFPKYKAYWGGFIILLCLSFLTLMYIPKHTLMQLFAYAYVVFLILSIILSPMGIIFLIKGNNLAWKNRRFESIDQFKNIQKKWLIWGCIIFLSLFIILLSAPDAKFSEIIIKASPFAGLAYHK